MFKKSGAKRQRGGQRSRQKSESGTDEDEDESAVKRVERSKVKSAFIQTTGTKRSKDEVKYSDDEEEQAKQEEEKKGLLEYKSLRTGKREGLADMGATSVVEFETEQDRDAQAIFQRQLDANKEQEGKADDGTYKGATGYTKYFETRDTAAGNAASGSVRQGPIRAPAHLRATVRWDYQPDICKDYKETGFCGFGDSCKFLHDRGDYKHGWQLEREHACHGRDTTDTTNYEVAGSDDEDDLPFACLICRESFTHPVITKCKHYFCEGCALAHFKKSTRCYVCSEQTFGVFNPAKEIVKKLKAEKEKAAIESEVG